MNFERLGEYKYRIPREGKMEVDAAFYASEKILEDLRAENYASLKQLQNVATLPGIVEPALTMPPSAGPKTATPAMRKPEPEWMAGLVSAGSTIQGSVATFWSCVREA